MFKVDYNDTGMMPYTWYLVFVCINVEHISQLFLVFTVLAMTIFYWGQQKNTCSKLYIEALT